MSTFDPKFDSSMVLRDMLGIRRARWSRRFRFAFLFPLLALIGGVATAAPAADAQNSTVPSLAQGRSFAIADFDGDRQADLANIQISSAGSNDYWVRLRLSTTGRHYIRVTAPEGGLLVEARDVNGDDAVDLVVASAWLDRPVAILLNDGHGNFTRVDPAAFPEAFRTSGTGWNSSVNVHFCPVALPRESSSGENSLAPCAEHLLRSKELLRFQCVRVVSVRPIAPSLGRAPPAAILL